MNLWYALAILFFFVTFICLWWAMVNPTEKERAEGVEAQNPWTAPIGVVCITVVFVSALFTVGSR